MVVAFIVSRLRARHHGRSVSRNHEGTELLASLVSDFDAVTDWVYAYELYNRNDDKDDPVDPFWQLAQLISCVTGTLAWLVIASDGLVLDLVWRALRCVAFYGIRPLLFLVVFGLPTLVLVLLGVLFEVLHQMVVVCCGSANARCIRHVSQVVDRWARQLVKWFQNVAWQTIDPIQSRLEDGLRISAGWVLLLGVLAEDLPQVLITFAIEDFESGQDGSTQPAALMNLLLAGFDILSKIANAWDSRMQKLTAGVGDYVRKVRTHKRVRGVVVLEDTENTGGDTMTTTTTIVGTSSDNDFALTTWMEQQQQQPGVEEDHPQQPRDTNNKRPAPPPPHLRLEGHTGVVYALARLTPRHVVSVSADRTARVFHTRTGNCVAVWNHPDEIHSVATKTTSSDGGGAHWVATGGVDGVIRLYRTTTTILSEVVAESPPVTEPTPVVDEEQPLTEGQPTPTIKKATQPVAVLDAETKIKITDLAFFIGGNDASQRMLLVSIAYNSKAYVWDIDTNVASNNNSSPPVVRLLKHFLTHRNRVHCVAPLHHSFLTGSDDATIKRWDKGGRCLTTYRGHSGPVYALCCIHSTQPPQFLSAGADTDVRLWDAHTGATSRRIWGGHAMAVRSLSCGANERWFVSASDDGTIRFWSLEEQNEEWQDDGAEPASVRTAGQPSDTNDGEETLDDELVEAVAFFGTSQVSNSVK